MGYGAGMGYGFGSFATLIWMGVFVWFILFTVLVLQKLDKLIELLSKK